jgi:hypothetical protein
LASVRTIGVTVTLLLVVIREIRWCIRDR